MKTATIHQPKTHLSRMLKEVQDGETIVILDGSTPVAKLTALDRPVARRLALTACARARTYPA